jgi:signal transduction histidine kinase
LSAKSVATGAIEQLKGVATIKHLLINCTIAEEVQVYADTHMLITILRNLISNAIKFTPSGGTITILATENSKETVFMVSDTGIGMTEKHIEQLFDIGEKVVTKGTNNEKGTGLGLVLCKDFVEKHGGRIHVKNKPGLGSTFMFTLPVKSVS